MKKNVKNTMKKTLAMTLSGLMAVGMTACGSGSGSGTGTTAATAKSPLDPKNPTTITIWNYYNGDQLTTFDSLISEFNGTVGVEEGIAVESVSQGSVDNLADCLLDAADGKVGAQDLPTLASVYAETALILEEKDQLVNLNDYFSEDELSKYVPDFLEEGRMVEGGDLYLFPVSKSTECFAVNKTDWQAFEDATGTTIDRVDSYETLTEIAEKYYEWTDSLTPDVANDGKALYGRDSVANYIYIGTKQLGHEMFKPTKDGVDVDLDQDSFKTLWDNYYIPYIKGYFCEAGKYRSDDMKTGAILAMTGSTSGISYLPTAVTDANDESHDIEIQVENPLYFKSGSNVQVQQGAGYCALKGTEEEQYAAAEFLKWFTEPERNLEFSVGSGYSPVTIEANDTEKIKAHFSGTEKKDQNILSALLVNSDVYMNEETYAVKPFDGSKDVRNLVSDSLPQIAAEDRAQVEKSLSEGKTLDEATAEYTTDEYFQNWFDTFSKSVNEIVQK